MSVIDVELVELVRWPGDADRRANLARAGIPRLLLIDDGAPLPDSLGIDEDWVRLPAAEDEIRARAFRLRRVVDDLAHHATPHIDEHRVLHRAGASVPLSAHEAAILTALLERPGKVVPRSEIEAHAWHGAAPSADAIDAAIYRLRRRLTGLGLSIRSVRSRGFSLQVA
jgi:DNA-binding response OmpR family regulator